MKFSSDSELRNKIIKFLRTFQRQNKEAPSVRKILDRFKITSSRFYELFPSGLAEACSDAAIPIPETRIESMQHTVARKRPEPSEGFTLRLNPEQAAKLMGICHLEGWQGDPLELLEKLFEEHLWRIRRGITAEHIELLMLFVDEAIKRGWSVDYLCSFIASGHNSIAQINSEIETLKQRKAMWESVVAREKSLVASARQELQNIRREISDVQSQYANLHEERKRIAALQETYQKFSDRIRLENKEFICGFSGLLLECITLEDLEGFITYLAVRSEPFLLSHVKESCLMSTGKLIARSLLKWVEKKVTATTQDGQRND